MLVVNRADFPVAIPFRDRRIIIPADRRVHEIPDMFFNQYNDLLRCVRPPIIKEKVVERKILQDVRIEKPAEEKVEQIKSMTFVKPRKTRGRKRTWDIHKNNRPTPENIAKKIEEIKQEVKEENVNTENTDISPA